MNVSRANDGPPRPMLDVAGAERVIAEDESIDTEFRSILRQLITFMMEDPRTISTALEIVWVAKAIERIGDHTENVYNRTQLLDEVWGDHVYVEERTVDVHVRRLRAALEASGHDRLIETVRGTGYCFRRAAPA